MMPCSSGWRPDGAPLWYNIKTQRHIARPVQYTEVMQIGRIKIALEDIIHGRHSSCLLAK